MVGRENWGEMKTGEYSDKTDKSWHACSASELPTVKDLRWQIEFLDSAESAFSAFGVSDCSRRAKEIERRLNDLISVVFTTGREGIGLF